MELFERKWVRWLFLLGGAFLTALTVSYPEQLGFLEWIAMIPSALIILTLITDRTVRLRRMYGIGLLFFWCYYAVAFHWFASLYPMEFTGMSPVAALFVIFAGIFGLSLLQALFSAGFFVLLAIAARSRAVAKYQILAPFLASAFFVIAEWFQTVGWWGVPWGRLAIGQSSLLPLIQSASLFGSYFISFLVLAVNFLLAFAVLHRKELLWLRVGSGVAAGLFLVNLCVGLILCGTVAEEGRSVCVAAIQGNISSQDKWGPDSMSNARKVYRAYTMEAAKEGAEIVVFPETALPGTFSEDSSLRSFAIDLASEANVILLVGAFDKTDKGESVNAIFTVYPDGTVDATVYGKRHLVPFGEYVPLRKLVTVLFPPLADIAMLEDDLCPGTDANVVDTGIGKIGSLICFDSIYEELARESVRDGAELIALSTNDSWFKDSSAIWMHNAQAVLRAVENGRYVVRAANTGVSTVIRPNGQVVRELKPLVGGYILSEIKMLDNLTLYTRIGNLFVYFCMLFCGGLIACRIAEGIVTGKKRSSQPPSSP